MLKTNVVAILEPKMDVILGIFLHILASGVVRNLTLATKYAF